MPEAGLRAGHGQRAGLDRDALWKNLALPAVIPPRCAPASASSTASSPDVVLGMGGYVMAPAIAAARMRGIPYVLHEKDVRPGLATRMFAGAAAAVCTTLPGHREAAQGAPHRAHRACPLREGFEPRTPAVPPRHAARSPAAARARATSTRRCGRALDELTRALRGGRPRRRPPGRARESPSTRRARYRGLTFSTTCPR